MKSTRPAAPYSQKQLTSRDHVTGSQSKLQHSGTRGNGRPFETVLEVKYVFYYFFFSIRRRSNPTFKNGFHHVKDLVRCFFKFSNSLLVTHSHSYGEIKTRIRHINFKNSTVINTFFLLLIFSGVAAKDSIGAGSTGVLVCLLTLNREAEKLFPEKQITFRIKR